MVQIQTFDPAPPERRGREQMVRDREVVTDQITRWLAERTRVGVQTVESDAVATFVARRAGTALPPFEEDGDSGALVVPGRVVVPTEALDEARDGLGRRRKLGESGLFAVTVPGLEGVRVLEEVAGPRRRRRSARETVDIARGVLGDGVEIAKCHMIPLSAVYKADGGPEPSGPRPGDDPWMRPVEDIRGPRVVVIDTGVSAEQRADGWLVGLAQADNLDLLDVVPQDDFLDLAAGHGQFVSGVVQQVAPGADLGVLRGLDTDGFGDEVEVARLIVAAARAGAQIINLSLGTFTADDRPPLLLQQALREAIAAQPDLLVVCAAGNHGSDRPCWPAAFHGVPEFADAVVSVGGLHREADDTAVGAPWSGRGDWVECSTFGEGVVSTFVIGTESPAGDQDPDTFGPSAWATWSGTSFATPQIVGAIVRTMQEDSNLTPRQALNSLLDKQGTPMAGGYGKAIAVLSV